MSKLNEAKVIPRYMLVSVLMTLVSCCVLGKAFYIMTAEKDSTRGNILSCDGRLMATTMPQYKIFMDFETLRSNPTDTAFADSLDAICQGLNEIFPEKPAEEFKAELKKGYAKRSRVWPVWKKRVDYDTWMEVSQLPVVWLTRAAMWARNGLRLRAARQGGHWPQHDGAQQVSDHHRRAA